MLFFSQSQCAICYRFFRLFLSDYSSSQYLTCHVKIGIINRLDWEEYDEEIFVVINGAAISLEACVNSGSGELAQVSVASRGTDVEIWDFIAESDVLAETFDETKLGVELPIEEV